MRIRATRLRSLCPGVPSVLDNKVVRMEKCATGGGGSAAVFEILTKWFSLTRLETRTKESNIYASIWVENPDA
jgi:hypothetical protein